MLFFRLKPKAKIREKRYGAVPAGLRRELQRSKIENYNTAAEVVGATSSDGLPSFMTYKKSVENDQRHFFVHAQKSMINRLKIGIDKVVLISNVAREK